MARPVLQAESCKGLRSEGYRIVLLTPLFGFSPKYRHWIASKRAWLGRKWATVVRFYVHYESHYFTWIVLYGVADILIFGQFSLPISDKVISEITMVFVTVEGVMVGLTPQLTHKRLRDYAALLGFLALLVTVGTFAKSTYETIQSGWLSWFPTTVLFILSGSFFVAMIEVYALAVFYPFERREVKNKMYAPE